MGAQPRAVLPRLAQVDGCTDKAAQQTAGPYARQADLAAECQVAAGELQCIAWLWRALSGGSGTRGGGGGGGGARTRTDRHAC